MRSSSGVSRGGWLVAGLTVALSVQAQDAGSPRVALYLEAGQARHDGAQTDAFTAGLRFPTATRFFEGRLTLSVDVYASRWNAYMLPGERGHFTQLGVVPMLRWRLDEGRSPWFVEGGVGASYLLDDYRTRTKTFGSRWNFSDHLGVGRSFGSQRRHELGLYVKHVSNAGLARPNPGETFYVLRYAAAF